MDPQKLESELLAFAASCLAEAKVPKQIVFVPLEKLPTTRTGKYVRVGLAQSLELVARDLRSSRLTFRLAESLKSAGSQESDVPDAGPGHQQFCR